jgi:hypothetical protein
VPFRTPPAQRIHSQLLLTMYTNFSTRYQTVSRIRRLDIECVDCRYALQDDFQSRVVP